LIEGGSYVSFMEIGRGGDDEGVEIFDGEKELVEGVEAGVGRDFEHGGGFGSFCRIGIGDGDELGVFEVCEAGCEGGAVVGANESEASGHFLRLKIEGGRWKGKFGGRQLRWSGGGGGENEYLMWLLGTVEGPGHSFPLALAWAAVLRGWRV